MQFGIHLLRCGLMTPRQFISVLEQQLCERPPIGMPTLETGTLTIHHLFEAFSAQPPSGRDIGPDAVYREYLMEEHLLDLLGWRCELTRPLYQIIAERGIVPPETLHQELRRFHDRRQAVRACDTPQRRPARELPAASPAPFAALGI